MQIAKIILTILFFIISIPLIILAMIQSKEDAGLSSTIAGASANNFFEQNKGRTKEGKRKKWTIILAIAFIIVAIALSIVYPV